MTNGSMPTACRPTWRADATSSVIPYGRQSISEEDIAAVVAVLRGDWLTQGPTIEAFEALLCEITGADHAVAFTSGTAALHGAAAAAGLGPGDVLGTSSLTFSASAACARYVGAEATLLDIDPATLNVDPSRVPTGLDALVAVHYAGLPMDLRALSERPAIVIEDAAHALGAQTPDGPVGNCAHSLMCCLSFHPVKPITTGEGGAVTTNDAAVAEELRRFRSHGIQRMPAEGDWYYEIHKLGFNYRITDIQAALGISQLARLSSFIDRRNVLADRYREALAGLAIALPPIAPEGWRHGYHIFPIRVRDRRRVFDGLRTAGVGVQVHYVPLHRQPVYADLGFGPADLPEAERAYQELISLPLHPGLTESDQDHVIDALTTLVAR
jgi:UDP-4-amino-4,6-dideoxy-N-acetyl-beta-L-altrosamine transaminase